MILKRVRVAEDISDKLYSDTWHSTHSIAYALFAMTRFFGLEGASEEFTFEAPGRSQRGVSQIVVPCLF